MEIKKRMNLNFNNVVLLCEIEESERGGESYSCNAVNLEELVDS